MCNQPNLPVLPLTVRSNLLTGVAFCRLAIGLLLLASATGKSAIAGSLTEMQIAQSVVDGLPPPPADARSVSSAPPVLLPSIAPRQDESSRRDANAATSEGYIVYVNGDSPLLLDQVRRVESNAFLQNYEGKQVIQAGLFGEEASAQWRVQQLEAQGIGAEVAPVSRDAMPRNQTTLRNQTSPALAAPQTVPSARTDRTTQAAVPQVEFGQSVSPYSTAQSTQRARRRSYYVVIPGSASRLPDIEDLIATLGSGLAVSEDAVQPRTAPLGNHVRVGPFVDRGAASRWSRFFRDFGMDARVYYGR